MFNWPSNNQQMMAQKLNEKQAIDQALSHDILFQLLSTAETYALGKNGKRHFKAYEYFNSSSKPKHKLKEQLLIQMETFKNSYRFFCHDFQEYDFPENLNKTMIIEFLNFWKSHVEEKDKNIYETIINIFDKNKSKGDNKMKYKIEHSMKKGQLNDIQMGNVADTLTKISYSNDTIAENAKKNLNEKGKYAGKVLLDVNGPIDPMMAKMNNYGDINKQYGNRHYEHQIDEDQDYN